MVEWEEIKQNTAGILFRYKLSNGWLVKEVQDVHLELNDGRNLLNHTGFEWSSSITFVPDSAHEWIINNK
jgi:hypothetical protein